MHPWRCCSPSVAIIIYTSLTMYIFMCERQLGLCERRKRKRVYTCEVERYKEEKVLLAAVLLVLVRVCKGVQGCGQYGPRAIRQMPAYTCCACLLFGCFKGGAGYDTCGITPPAHRHSAPQLPTKPPIRTQCHFAGSSCPSQRPAANTIQARWRDVCDVEVVLSNS